MRGGGCQRQPQPGSTSGPSPALVEAPTATVTLTTTLTLTPTLTPTATTTLTPTLILTPTLTSTPTVTATLTLTPTPIASATPPVTLTPAPSAALSLRKASAPDIIAPGEVVTFTLVLSNSGTAPARNLLLRDTLPQGLTYLPGSAPKAEYDPLAASLTWNLSGLEAGQAISRTLAARAVVLPGEMVTNTATLSGADLTRPLTATAAVYVSQAGLIRPETGGSVRSADGRIELDFPPGAVQGLTEVSYRPLAPVDLPSGQQLFYRFELKAWQAGRPDLPVSTFARPVTVTVIYTDGEVEGLLEEGLRLVSWDEGLGTWTPISTTVDVAASRLTAHLSHFSVYAASGDAEVFFQPRIEAGQVSLLSGDSSFRYDLDVPAGAGGLKVPLTLQYNGGIPNALTKPLIGSDTNSDTGWVGVGWSFDVGRFEDELLTFNGLSTGVKVLSNQSSGTVSRCSPQGCTPGPSAPWCICESGSLAHRQQQTTDVQFYKIESDRFVGPVIESLDRVDVWTKDGTHYTLGNQGYVPSGTCTLPSGAQVQCGTGSRLYATRNSGARVYPAYKLDSVVDTHGNRVEIEYTVFPKPGSNHTQLKESYPSRILYTTNPGAGDNHAEYEIQFVVDKKAFDKKADKKFAETGYYLKTVNVWFHYDPNDPADWETKRLLVRQYRFEYDAQLIASGTAYELVSITQYAPDQAQHLPAMSFGYTPRTIGWRINGYLGGTWYTVSRRFLQTVDNGYGGTLTFGYEDWNCYDYASAGEVGNEPFTCAGYAAERLSWRQRQLVQSKSLSPGSGTPLVTDYAYEKADVKWTRDPPAGTVGCRGKVTGGKYETCYEEFIGFEKATEDWQSGSQTLKRTETRFHDTEGQPKIDQRRGKVEEMWLKDGSGALYDHTTTTYAVYTATGWPEGMQFVYASQVNEESCASGACRSKRTTYEYATGPQGGQQYGNPTQIQEYDENDQVYRTTRRWYNPREAMDQAPPVYIVDRIMAEAVYEGGGWTEKSTTWYYYDQFGSHQAELGDRGELWAVQLLLHKEEDASTVYWEASETRYSYDDYGNQTGSTEYAGYAQMEVDKSVWVAERSGGPSGPRTTTMAYDGGHHTFPLTVTNPLSHSMETRYYGVDGVAADEGLPGQVASVTDANALESVYQYDAFGRLVKEIRPGDSEGLPTVRHYYRDAYPARRISAYREESGQGGNLPVVEFYDGLGRLLQTRSESQEASQQAVVNYTYDGLGRRAREHVPRFEAFSWEYSPPSGPYTAYSYDVLGRPTLVTEPDGSQRQQLYRVVGGWMDIIGRGFRQEEVVDANGHRTFYTYDAFERLVWVGQKDDGGWCNALHLALYDYDVVDNLVQVTCGGYICGTTYTAGSITTGMDYDLLGRKEGMDDADMGAWSYEYDAAGNLVSQTDAREQTITFAYDDLNRLVAKDLPAGADAYYIYDEPGYGESVGRRTGMTDGSGATAYYYDDERGRLSSESKTINAAGTFTTTFAYDAMDRVVSMTYPDGEVLTTTYNAQGLPATLTGGSQLLAWASYNALGQTEVLTFGNGITTTYQYYPAETGNNRLWKLQVGDGDLLDLAYGYDLVGNVSQLTDTHPTIGGVLAFSYDSLDRLTGVSGAYPAQYAYSAIGNLELKAEDGITYTLEYTNPNHVHAVSKVNGVSQAYDANGNMTLRVVNGVTYTQTWDAENRLVQVISGTHTTQFVYDADGALVKRVVDGETTVYVGNQYEKILSPELEIKYYYFNGSRVAMRKAGVLQYIVGDHLGTTSLILNAGGTVHSEARHYPYGQERWASGTLPTDYRFTGQRNDSYIKLVHMGARFYDSALGRFVSPDSIVPDFASPQSLNRYTYCLGDPLVFVDPTGHASIPPWLQPIVQGLRDGARRFFDQHTSVHPGSEPAPKPINREVAQALSTGAIVCDTLALAISGGGALAELGLAMAGSVDPLPVEELGGVAFYYEFVNPIENVISLAGTAFTAGADIFAGQTEISIESGSIRFGQDTLVSGTALFLGNALPLEGFLDTLVNGPLLWYDAQRAGENWPTYVELVCDTSGCRLEVYLNETPQEEPLESGEVDAR